MSTITRRKPITAALARKALNRRVVVSYVDLADSVHAIGSAGTFTLTKVTAKELTLSNKYGAALLVPLAQVLNVTAFAQ